MGLKNLVGGTKSVDIVLATNELSLLIDENKEEWESIEVTSEVLFSFSEFYKQLKTTPKEQKTIKNFTNIGVLSSSNFAFTKNSATSDGSSNNYLNQLMLL